MIGLYQLVVGFCLPMNGRDHFRKKVDVQICCWENIIQCNNLSWRERVNAYEKLGELFEYKYVLDHMKHVQVKIVPEYSEDIDTVTTIENEDTDEGPSCWFDIDH